MKQEVKEKWLDALRSGDYKQARFILRNGDDEFCCLGVLCDLYAQKNKAEWMPEGRAYSFKDAAGIETQQILPPNVVKWSGLPDDVGTVKDVGTLASLNDSGKSFKEIADIIEENF